MPLLQVLHVLVLVRVMIMGLMQVTRMGNIFYENILFAKGQMRRESSYKGRTQ